MLISLYRLYNANITPYLMSISLYNANFQSMMITQDADK